MDNFNFETYTFKNDIQLSLYLYAACPVRDKISVVEIEPK